MPDRRLPIDVRLWALLSLVLFVGFVLLDLTALGGGPTSFARNAQDWWAGTQSSGETLNRIMPRSVLYAIGAGIVAWPIHCFLVIAGIRFGSLTCWLNIRDYEELKDSEIGPLAPWDEHLSRMAALREKGELLRRGRKCETQEPNKELPRSASPINPTSQSET